MNMSRISLLIGVLSGLIALAGAWIVIPYRMEAAEKKLQEHEAQLVRQNDILIRIDENVKELRRSQRISIDR